MVQPFVYCIALLFGLSLVFNVFFKIVSIATAKI